MCLKDLTIKNGVLEGARQLKSPNYGQRPPGKGISLLVIHNISLPPGQFGTSCVEDFFCNQLDAESHPSFADIADLQVSSHLFIKRSGDVTQFVNFNDRAWHAGVSVFKGVENCNDFSIGIELEGTDIIPYTDVQYKVLTYITRLLIAAYPLINEQRIVGHCDIAPTRKTDPGPVFDWRRYRQAVWSV